MKKPTLAELLDFEPSSIPPLGKVPAVKFHRICIKRLRQLIERDNVGDYSGEALELLRYRQKAVRHYENNLKDIFPEKEPFPEFEDIDTMTADKWFWSIIHSYVENLTMEEEYRIYKSAYENGVNVTWKLKEKQPKFKVGDVVETYDGHFVTIKYITGEGRYVTKEHPQGSFIEKALKPINRKLHENRALAVAVGKWLVENSPIDIGEYSFLCGIVDIKNSKRPFKFLGEPFHREEAVLPDDYEIPEQVLKCMKEYEKEMQG